MTNEDGDTALREPVLFQHLSVVKVLVREDSDLQYSANEAGETPICIASERGYRDIVFELLDKCTSPAAAGPCGRSALHIATILKDKDEKLIIAAFIYHTIARKGLETGMRIVNPASATANIGDERGNNEDERTFVNRFKEANLIVAALIATVTFTAIFTLPGGYMSEKGPLQGTPVLGKSPAFKSFIVMDAIAMVLSSAAVFFHTVWSLHQSCPWTPLFIGTALLLTTLALAAMVVAFVTATYAVLAYSTGLAIAICVIGLSFFIFLFAVSTKL
nr:protein ACCELERATED CELL DEATH 6-like [Ziziphus jujuba var. spinosa]